MNGSLQSRLQRALKKFSTDRDYSELVRTSFFALLVRMTGVFTGFLVTLLTARYFGADALGIVAICLAILSFASVFGKAGLDVALMKYIAGFSLNKNYAGIKSVYLSALNNFSCFSCCFNMSFFIGTLDGCRFTAQTLTHQSSPRECLACASIGFFIDKF